MAYWIVKVILTPFMRLAFGIRCEGRENVPKKGPAILASNHQSFIDSLFLPLVVHRKVTFVAKAEYFESWKTAWFFRAVGMIPLKREGGSASQRALLAAKEVLDSGGVLGIYPEGTRSPDGRLYKGHTGAARLARECNAPIVPVAQFGTAAVQPIGASFPHLFRKVRVVMGPPLRWHGTEEDGLRPFINEVMTAIAALSGQEMVGEYAKRDLGRLAAPGSEADPFPPDTAAARA
jgi:1-acyl-sn-glycerol-3-phosphate acyltransferase